MAKSSAKIITYQAPIEKIGAGMKVDFPEDANRLYGTKGQVKVKATFDGHQYRGILSPMGGRHVIGLRKDIAEAIGKTVGDLITVTITPDTEERTVDMPPALTSLLSKNKPARFFFDSLSYTNRKEYAVWISSAAKEETRKKRLDQVVPKLLAGKKNPSER